MALDLRRVALDLRRSKALDLRRVALAWILENSKQKEGLGMEDWGGLLVGVVPINWPCPCL